MSVWLAQGFDKAPRSDAEMFRQSVRASIRTGVFAGWLYWKTFGFIFRKLRIKHRLKGVIKMVFGRGKKKDAGPIFMPQATAQQMAQQMAQMQEAIPVEFPYPQSYPPPIVQPVQPVQQPMQPPAQPPMAQQPMQQPVVRPAGRPAPPQPVAAAPNILEQMMQFVLSLGEKMKYTDERLLKIETDLVSVEEQLNDLYERLNLLQGVKGQPMKRVKFTKQ
jgi:hypothetical protein